MFRTSLATSSSITTRTKSSGAWPLMASQTLQAALACVGDLEERVEFGQLEQRLEIVVQVREPQLPALLPNFLGQRHEHAQARAVDVAGPAEIDQELPLALLQLIQDFLFELLAVPDDELPFDIDHYDLSLLGDREAHVCSPSGSTCDCNAVMAATWIMSSGAAPRERSADGRAKPCKIGPIAVAPASRCTSL